MEGVEDIPADALKAGLGTQPDGGWEWETFPESVPRMRPCWY